MMKELIVEESAGSDRIVEMSDFENLEKVLPVKPKEPLIHPTFSTIDHLEPENENYMCHDGAFWFLNGKKVTACSTRWVFGNKLTD